MTIYFISDLHLQNENLANTKLFFKFLANYASKAEQLYILGDFFDVWLGDDDEAAFIQTIKNEFAKLKALGVAVYFLRGNRDFLLGDEFIRSMHCEPIPDPSVITFGDEQVLLIHGDLLTTDDKEYLKFRKVVRHPITRFIFLSLPKILRQKIAAKIRNNSANVYKRKLTKNPKVFAVSQAAVEDDFCQHKVTTMIHGHIHLPGWHDFTLNNLPCKRIVLGDWGDSAKIISYANGKFELITI